MIWEFVATLSAGIGAAGIMMMIRLFIKKLPKWLVPAAAGLGMIGFQVYSEYTWFSHTRSLLPESAVDRAHVRALAQSIACEIHPLNNLRVLSYLVKEIKVDEEKKTAWYHHWVRSGLEAFERQLASHAARRQVAGLPPSVYCHGTTPTLADCCLVPQIFNAQRFGTQLDGLPHTMAAFDACMQLAAFQNAHPSRCPDAAP